MQCLWVGGGAGSSVALGAEDGVSRLARNTLFVRCFRAGGRAGSNVAMGTDDGVSRLASNTLFVRCL